MKGLVMAMYLALSTNSYASDNADVIITALTDICISETLRETPLKQNVRETCKEKALDMVTVFIVGSDETIVGSDGE